jgi:TRAP-type C4-dicarboxylate transport system permease small subunit
MKKVLKVLDYVENIICVACILVMLALAFANVIGRYVLHASISYTEEVTCALFVLLCVMGTAIAARAGTHLGLTILTERFPKKMQRIICCCTNLLAAACCMLLLYLSIGMVQNQIRLQTVSATLQLPTWIYGLALPVGAVFMTVRFIQAAVQALKSKEEVTTP